MNRQTNNEPKSLKQNKLSVHSWFESQVDKTPESVAVTCGDCRLTFRDLNERANQLAHHLQQFGVKPEVPVALCLERSIEMLVAIVAVLKAGGAYVPVDLAYPKERLSFMLGDSKAPILLTQKNLLDSLPQHSARVICLDLEWEQIARQPKENPEVDVKSENVAYILYTSGSTGQPKGCLVTHHNVVRLFTATDHWYSFNSEDVWTLFHSYAFDFSVWEIWGALLYGGRLVVVPYHVSRSPDAFYELLGKEKVTVLNQTPSAFRQLIWGEVNAVTKQKLNLRYIIFGGEALEFQSLKPWFEQHGDEKPQLVNMYGITETTVHVTYRPIRKADLSSGGSSVIGVPIPDLQLYLLDENLKPVAACVPGEIFVGGAGVARGYLNRTELTNERFIPDFFSYDPRARLYRSGDLAQYLPNGEIEYLGRIDHQVKIRGFRIELGEIESALNQHPAIRESVVIDYDATVAGDKRLAAYLVPKQSAPSITELREYLARKIPEYMLPGAFIFLESLPLTPNGKVDRKALPSPDSRTTGTEYVATRYSVEHLLAEVWSQTFGFSKIGIRDNFFELGGDSISSIAALSRAQQRGLNFSIEQLFQNPTIESLATSIALNSNNKATLPQTVPFSLISAEDRAKIPDDVEDAYPMIQLQTGMFYHNDLNPLSAVYHIVLSFKVHSAFDREKLEQTVHQLLQRHPVLRTSFHIVGFSEPMQLVHRKAKAPFTVEDLQHCSPKEQDKKTVEWIEAEKHKPYDRTIAPLVRFHTQQTSDDSFQFIVSYHHACLDGWSFAALLTEVFEDYATLMGQGNKAIAAPRICYRDFVAIEKQALLSEASRQFWKEKFADAPVSSIPRWPKSMCEGGHEQKRGPELFIDSEVFEGLKRIAQTAGVPLKTILFTAHQVVMSTLYGQTDVTSGLVCNGRPEEIDGEKLIGLFLNTLPIRSQLNGGTWLDLVKETFKAEQEIMPYRRMPLAEIQQMRGGQPLFEAAFNFVHFHVYKNLQDNRDLELTAGHYFEANSLTTLTTFTLAPTSARLQMHIDYDPNAITREQVTQISNYYLNTLASIAGDPNGAYEKFSPLTSEEKQQIIVKWNDTTEDYPREQCLHQLVEAQVEKTPNAVALVFENQTLTYRELNARAEKIAGKLRSLGIVPDTLVGIHVERSPEVVIGLLGILKAGAAYVPLDPAYPKERLALMISDAQLPVILTRRQLAAGLPESSAKIVAFEDEASFSPADASNVTSRNLIYTLYTSGSTGKPKGVQIEHRSVVNMLTSFVRTTNITAKDNLLSVSTISFDIACLEIFVPLITGAQLTLVSQEKTADGIQLANLITSSGATVLQATPATWRMLFNADWLGNPGLKVFCGGEALSRKMADELSKRSREVWNLYGPTETTIWSTMWKVVPDGVISIGRPVANAQHYILDKQLRPVPVGVTGELYIGGDGLGRGYLNRGELTAEKFITNPFSDEKGSRIYNTGDLARYLPDGRVECLGRSDHQVKIRGFRIELGDIEAALRQHPTVKEALVVTREERDEARLVAYVTTHNGPPSISELRDFLKTKLPHYMIPSAFVLMESFPLSPNGKIDRRSLPKPEPVQERSEIDTAPRSCLENQLIRIWQEVLGRQTVSVRDNFFELGGHSLLAVKLFSQIEKHLGQKIPLQILFQAPTIEQLANIMREKGWSPAGASLVEIKSEGSRPPIFWLHTLGGGGGGGLFTYQKLAQLLGEDQPSYGFVAPHEPHSDIEDMAAHYLKELRGIQPEGPFSLGGYCFGGVIAYEMARQLTAQGEQVALVALIESIPPQTNGSTKWSPELVWHVGKTLPSWLLHLARNREKMLPRVTAKIKSIRTKFAGSSSNTQQSAKNNAIADLSAVIDMSQYPKEFRRFAEIHWAALLKYSPKPFPGKVTLFRTRQPRLLTMDLEVGWRRLALGGVEVRMVSGLHETILRDPYVHGLAEELKICLAQQNPIHHRPEIFVKNFTGPSLQRPTLP